jgi:hypothetical protein
MVVCFAAISMIIFFQAQNNVTALITTGIALFFCCSCLGPRAVKVLLHRVDEMVFVFKLDKYQTAVGAYFYFFFHRSGCFCGSSELIF